jgi:hypothetical protein
LALEKNEKNFEFYNVSSEKFFGKGHLFTFLNKTEHNTITKRESSISKFFGIFSNKKFPKQDNITLDGMEKESIYKKTQYFLESLYKKLFFICLNYEDSEIQIYEIESLINIKKVKTIIFENSQISTLQFVDNMILLHNFERCDTLLIDMKSENQDKVLCKLLY